MIYYGFLALIPPILAIYLAIKTKDVIVSLVSSVVVGTLILTRGNPYAAFVTLWKDLYFKELSTSWNAELLILMAIIGGFVEIMERSGGSRAFSKIVTKAINNRLKAQIAAWCGGLLIFFSDSANSLILGPIFRPIFDRLKVSREKLAYILDSTSSPVCVMLPITTWAVLIAGLVQNEYSRLGIAEQAYTTYARTIPFLFYPMLALLLIPLVAFTGREFGPMAKAEHRAFFENKPWSENSNRLNVEQHNIEESETKASVVAIPLIVLFVTIVVMFISFGFPGPLEGFQTRISLATAYILSAITCAILTAKNKIMTFSESIGTILEGMQKMTYMLVVLLTAFCLGNICGQLGTAAYIVRLTESFITPALIPALMFLIGCIVSFATGTSNGTFAILIPIVVPMAAEFGIPMPIAIASAVSGGLFGDHCSPISDTTILSATASGCDNIDHVKTQLPYALVVAAASFISFIIAALTPNTYISTVVAIALLVIVYFASSKVWGEVIPNRSIEEINNGKAYVK